MKQKNLIKLINLVMVALFFMAGLGDAKPPKDLLSKINSESFQERDEAHAQLRKWSFKNIKTAPEQLFSVWKASNEPEVKARCHQLMKEVLLQRKFGKGQGFIGIRMQETIYKDQGGKARVGVQISSVQDGRPGAKAGLKMNDIIVGVDKLDFTTFEVQPQRAAFIVDHGVVDSFGQYIRSKEPDEVITLALMRGEKKMKLKVKLMKRPPEAELGFLGRRMLDDREKLKREYFERWKKTMGAE